MMNEDNCTKQRVTNVSTVDYSSDKGSCDFGSIDFKRWYIAASSNDLWSNTGSRASCDLGMLDMKRSKNLIPTFKTIIALELLLLVISCSCVSGSLQDHILDGYGQDRPNDGLAETVFKILHVRVKSTKQRWGQVKNFWSAPLQGAEEAELLHFISSFPTPFQSIDHQGVIWLEPYPLRKITLYKP